MTIRTYQFQTQVLVTSAAGTTFNRSVTDNLNLGSFVNGIFRDVTDDLNLLSQPTFVYNPGGVNAGGHDLGLTHEATSQLHPFVVDELGLIDTAEGQFPIHEIKSHTLNLGNDVAFRWGVRNFSNEDALGITHEVNLAQEFSVVHVLGLVDEAVWLNVFDVLSLTDLAEWGYGVDASNVLDVTDDVQVDQVLNKSLTDADVVTQAVAWYIENSCNRWEFKSFHGEGGVPPAEEHLHYKSDFLFQSLQDGEVLTLRNPETDNRRRYSFNRVNRSFFDNTADIFADDAWVTENNQIYTIVANKREKLDALFLFLQNNLGLEILLKDWQGVTWQAIILNPGEIYTEDGEGVWTLDFEVTADMHPGEVAFTHLDLMEDLSRAGSIWTRSASHTDVVTDRANRHYDEDVPSDDLSLGAAAVFTVVTP